MKTFLRQNPVYFSDQELDLIADALSEVRARQFCAMVSNIPESEKDVAYRKFALAEGALKKVRTA